PLLSLCAKLAEHTEGGAAPIRPDAESAPRAQVQELVADWSLADPNPSQYSVVLERVAQSTRLFLLSDDCTLDCEPERIVQISLETGMVGVDVLGGVEAMLQRRRLRRLVDLLEHAPEGSEAVGVIW